LLPVVAGAARAGVGG